MNILSINFLNKPELICLHTNGFKYCYMRQQFNLTSAICLHAVKWLYISHLPTPPLGQDMTQRQFFKAEFNRFEFRVFLLLDKLPYQG